MRLIDVDAVDDIIQTLNENEWHITRDEYKRIDRILFEIPTVDAVEVVRCKDCKYWRDGDCKNDSHGYCPISENDFCSQGERREDEIRMDS